MDKKVTLIGSTNSEPTVTIEFKSNFGDLGGLTIYLDSGKTYIPNTSGKLISGAKFVYKMSEFSKLNGGDAFADVYCDGKGDDIDYSDTNQTNCTTKNPSGRSWRQITYYFVDKTKDVKAIFKYE